MASSGESVFLKDVASFSKGCHPFSKGCSHIQEYMGSTISVMRLTKTKEKKNKEEHKIGMSLGGVKVNMTKVYCMGFSNMQ